MRIEFVIPYPVQPKQSVRGCIAHDKNGKPYVATYQTQAIKKNAKNLASLVAPHRPSAPLEGPLRVWYVVRYAFRKSEPKKNRKGPIAKDTKPDADQLAKQLSDVLESCGFFANDSQIADLRVLKMWDAEPGVRVVIDTLTA